MTDLEKLKAKRDAADAAYAAYNAALDAYNVAYAAHAAARDAYNAAYAAHAAADPDDRTAYDLYAAMADYPDTWARRETSPWYLSIRAAIKRGRELERGA